MADEDQLIAEVCELQSEMEAVDKDTRSRVIQMGRRLKRLQKWQKGIQTKAKKAGQDHQTWKEWCEEQKVARGNFPEFTNVARYTLIATYPKAYKPGMSIKEGYKQAGLWKKNGGNEPIKEKTVIKARPLITIGAAAGKLHDKMEKLLEKDWDEVQGDDEWTEDEILGATDEVTILRQSCNVMLRRLKEIHHALT